MFSYLPIKIKQALKTLDLRYVYEFRIRLNRPCIVNYNGHYCFLSDHGLSNQNGIMITMEDIEKILMEASEHSFYSVAEEMKNGFITTNDGERIGLAGKILTENSTVRSMSDITSLCIRIPHKIADASKNVLEMIPYPCNTLLISLPGRGKTTILRDIVFKLNAISRYQICIVDDRHEFTICNECSMCDIIDVLSKERGINYAVRAMRPDILFVDELAKNEYKMIEEATFYGVMIYASMHGNSVLNAPNGFERYVLLGNNIGEISEIYDRDKRKIYG